MDSTVHIWVPIALGVVVVFLLLLIWSGRRTLGSNLRPAFDAGIDELLPNLAELTGGDVKEGNRVQVLHNGDPFFGALLEDVARATVSVHLETYVWWRGEITHRLAEALAAKAREGLAVRLILDAHGSLAMEPEVARALDEGGCRVCYFHRFRLRDLAKLNSRDHRKLAVIDGRIAYLMGHGVAEQWTGNARDESEWRDTAVRLEGPIVRDVQSLFLRNWLTVNDEIVIAPEDFPPLEPAGEVKAHLAASAPAGSFSEVELLYKVAISAARESILIQNPYFVPDQPVVDLLVQAAERGVDVRVMLPRKSDSRLVRHASHVFYGDLLRGGVHLYEYLKTFAHQKVMVVDGIWSHIGSTNFDHRSLQINYEVAVGMLDRGVAEELTAAFEEDLESSVEVTVQGWQSRNALRRLGDNLAYLIREQL
jgi:cardiolipin synthase